MSEKLGKKGVKMTLRIESGVPRMKWKGKRDWKERPRCRKVVLSHLAEGFTLEGIAGRWERSPTTSKIMHFSDGLMQQARKMIYETKEKT